MADLQRDHVVNEESLYVEHYPAARLIRLRWKRRARHIIHQFTAAGARASVIRLLA
jgi:hypothetical protein